MNAVIDELTMIHAEFGELRQGQFEVWREVLLREELERAASQRPPLDIEHIMHAAFCGGFDVGVMAARMGRN